MAGTAIKNGLGALSRMAAPKVVEPSPLSQLIAARMIGQLNAVPEIGGLSALRSVNLPAAYAGDQRSLKAAQRVINEAETGLQSPGRRKMLKQGAAMTARAALPDALKTEVYAMAPRVPADAAIPDEVVQDAIWSQIAPIFAGKGGRRLLSDWGRSLLFASDDIGDVVVPSTKDIASKTGLPVEAIDDFLKRQDLTINKAISDIATTKAKLSMYEDGASLDELGHAIDSSTIDEVVSSVIDAARKAGIKKNRFNELEFENLFLGPASDDLELKFTRSFLGQPEKVFGQRNVDDFLDAHNISDDLVDMFNDHSEAEALLQEMIDSIGSHGIR
jgi:hypothetical protein